MDEHLNQELLLLFLCHTFDIHTYTFQNHNNCIAKHVPSCQHVHYQDGHKPNMFLFSHLRYHNQKMNKSIRHMYVQPQPSFLQSYGMPNTLYLIARMIESNHSRFVIRILIKLLQKLGKLFSGPEIKVTIFCKSLFIYSYDHNSSVSTVKLCIKRICY